MERQLRDYLWNVELWREVIWEQTFYSPEAGLAYRVRGAATWLDENHFSFWKRWQTKMFMRVSVAQQKRYRQNVFMDVEYVGKGACSFHGALPVFQHLNDELAGAIEYAASGQKVQRWIDECLARDMANRVV